MYLDFPVSSFSTVQAATPQSERSRAENIISSISTAILTGIGIWKGGTVGQSPSGGTVYQPPTTGGSPQPQGTPQPGAAAGLSSTMLWGIGIAVLGVFGIIVAAHELK